MELNGIVASDGIVIGKIFKYEKKGLEISNHLVDDIEEEIFRFKEAIDRAINDLNNIIQKDEKNKDIFNAHKQILKDPELIEKVELKINQKKLNAQKSFEIVTNDYIKIFEEMDDEYFSQRAIDIRDIANRVISKLIGKEEKLIEEIDEPRILVANDLTPSDTAKLDNKKVKGFITEVGGKTSHSAIIARSSGFPAIVGVKDIINKVKQDDVVILDAINGKVKIKPDKNILEDYRKKIKEYKIKKRNREKLKNELTKTKCGKNVELSANIATISDLDKVINNGAEGIGLYRTEFLYMESNKFPTEQEQFEAYKKVVEKLAPKPVVIRTLDIGGDKNLKYLDMPDELNPFLGHRAIRLCLEKKDMFKTQIRALLRASNFGDLKIMFPMIATLEDFYEAKNVIDEVKIEFDEKNISYSDDLEVGIMVEIPSTALVADLFAQEVDFFSIGTNDLIQYTFAADRMNEKVSYLYQPYNPALLKLIKNVIESAHKENKWVGMCGEMASDPIAIPLLIGLGLDEFSMSSSKILKSRELIGELEISKMSQLVKKALNERTSQDVVNLVKSELEI